MMRTWIALLLTAALGAGETTDEAREATVELKAGVAAGKVRLGYSSPRKIAAESTVPRFVFEVPEFQSKHPVFFRMALGETEGVPFYCALDKSQAGLYHDLLYVDRNRDLDLTNDGQPVAARIRTMWTREGKLVEFLDVKLDLPYRLDGKSEKETYACVVYYLVENANAPKPPQTVLVERDSWREGAVEIGGAAYKVVVVDDDSDGQFSTSDSWVLRPAGADMGEMLSKDAVRAMLFPAWSSDQKWTVEVKGVGQAGRSLKIAIAPSKETEREYFVKVARQQQTNEERQLKIDPLRPKASSSQKVEWLVGKDVKYALEIAGTDRTPNRVLLDFTAKTCHWCAKMNQYTFRDREVVQLSKRFVCAKIDFPSSPKDANAYSVEGTPTYVITDEKGVEQARHAGFLRPTEFAAWLKAALR